ncbi:gamma carbonic anhydrase family protein [Deltaproteobacteria bacterium]|nr:gamma carbonic anhydrase family protein [Deltaproteobacteria bacterium]
MIRSFRGKTPKIADSVFVSEAAYIIGDVEISENSSVWPGAVIRGDFGKITIGKNCAVEDNSVIHSGSPSADNAFCDVIIGNNVHIGHGAVLNCRRIGNSVLIGINSTILHDVEIGDFCIIGAACMVNQGMVIPDRSFVAGVPAKIKGEVSDRQLYWLEEAPKSYVQLAEEYKKEMIKE